MQHKGCGLWAALGSGFWGSSSGCQQLTCNTGASSWCTRRARQARLAAASPAAPGCVPPPPPAPAAPPYPLRLPRAADTRAAPWKCSTTFSRDLVGLLQPAYKWATGQQVVCKTQFTPAAQPSCMFTCLISSHGCIANMCCCKHSSQTPKPSRGCFRVQQQQEKAPLSRPSPARFHAVAAALQHAGAVRPEHPHGHPHIHKVVTQVNAVTPTPRGR